MRLDQLYLRNFRNYPELRVDWGPGLNILVGANGQGKSNLVEAVYFLSRGSSFRQGNDEALLRWNEEFLRVSATVVGREGSFTVEIRYPRGGRKAALLNGTPVPRLHEALGQLAVVLFSPDDLALVKGEPEARRRFLDEEVAQRDPLYQDDLRRYRRVVSQRNFLLREKGGNRALPEAEAWDGQLIATGCRLLLRRLHVLRCLQPLVEEAYARAGGDPARLTLAYSSSLDPGLSPDAREEDLRELFATRLAAAREEETRQGMTLLGPHRDDLHVYLDGKPLRVYGSQGQQRLAVLSLKMAAAAFLHRQTGEQPIFLLDDVFSELDAWRREGLLRLLPEDMQVILTTAQNEEWKAFLPVRAQVMYLEGGKLSYQLLN